ncbi:MAG: sulfate adenylyltransferase [Oligoflexia bacterium]|nr:sulfate adenylyltransferase [Oligoflexia bacterium]
MQNQMLNSPYGGSLVQRIAASSEASEQKVDNSIFISDIIESDLWNIATGAFSPLQGFMGEKDFLSVCQNMKLSSSALAWTIPIVLDLSEEERSRVNKKQKIFLVSKKNKKCLGYIEPDEIYPHDKELHMQSVFGTSDYSHPGVYVVSQMKPFLVGGNVSLFQEAFTGQDLVTPSELRNILRKKNLFQIAGFQTRNVVHRAHEHLQRIALEAVGGVLIHPVIGWKKQGDFKPEAVKKAYAHFIEKYYPHDRAVLAFLNLAMRYAGPKEAVFHAIVRKNFGCSHFIVGRDHAGVGDFYEKYAAHKIFNSVENLGIEILRLREPYFCAICNSITSDSACNHSEESKEYISGTKIRSILKSGNDPTGYIFREDVLDILNSLSRKDLFYE